MKSNKILMILLPFVILAAAHIIMGLAMEVPVVAVDEFTYLAYARYFAGLDMLFVPGGGLVGSFGYSLLISPAFLINPDPSSAYQIAVVINSIIASSMYIGLFLLLRMIFDAKPSHAAITSFITSLYPAFMLQSNMVWTDAVTPAIFIFNMLSFAYLIKKKTIFHSIIFALITSYFFSVHVRAIPVLPISIVTLIYLVYRKRLPALAGILPIIIIGLASWLVLSYGDSLANMVAGKQGGSEKIEDHLILMLDVIILALFVLIIGFFIKRNKWSYIAGFVSGWIFGMMFSVSILFFFIPAAAITYMFLANQGTSKKFNMVNIILLTLLGAVLAYILFPDLDYVRVNFTILLTWSTNFLSRIFYLSFATWGVFLLGFLGIFVFVWNNRKKLNGSFSDEAIALIFLFATAIGMFAITIPIIKYIDTIRPDLLFYGRYVEVFLAPFLALGIYGFIEDTEIENGFFRVLTSLAVMIISAFGIIALYGNFIESEPSFRNFLSFFPPRAIFGSIDILIYLGIMLAGLIIISILFKKSFNLGGLVLTLAFLSFTIFTYRYVILYHQLEKQKVDNLSNTVIDVLNAKSISCVFGNKSPDIYHYQYLHPDLKINYGKDRKSPMPAGLILASSDQADINDNLFPVDIEYGGRTILLTDHETSNIISKKLFVPGYFRMELIDKNVIGIKRKGFFSDNTNGDNWINGKSSINIPLMKSEKIRKIKLKTFNNSKRPRFLSLSSGGQLLFEGLVSPGTDNITINADTIEFQRSAEIIFKAKLSRIPGNSPEIEGIQLVSLKILGKSAVKEKSGETPFVDGFNYNIRLAPNYNFFTAEKYAGKTMALPIILENTGSVPIDLKNREISIRAVWHEFLLEKQVYSVDIKGSRITLLPGESGNAIIQLPIIKTPGRYFLDLGISQNRTYITPASGRCQRMMVVVDK